MPLLATNPGEELSRVRHWAIQHFQNHLHLHALSYRQIPNFLVRGETFDRKVQKSTNVLTISQEWLQLHLMYILAHPFLLSINESTMENPRLSCREKSALWAPIRNLYMLNSSHSMHITSPIFKVGSGLAESTLNTSYAWAGFNLVISGYC